MRLHCILVAVFLGLVAADHTVDLTDNDFEAKIASYETALVMFYAPWCGHCKRLKPEFEKAADVVKNDDPAITLVKVDCTEGGKSVCSKFGVQGYPTLKIFRNGEISSDYNGPREAPGIVKFMRAQVGPSARDLTSNAAVERFLASDDVGVIGLFESDSDLKAEFMKLADKLREKVRFGISSAKEVLEKHGQTNGIVLFRPKNLQSKFEPSSVEYKGKAAKEDINTFIEENYHGLCGHRTTDNSAQFKAPLLTAYYAVDYVKNAKGTNYWRNRILKVAKEATDLKFCIANKDDFQQEMNEYGFDYIGDDKPRVSLRQANGAKYVMKEEFSVENLEKFLADVKEGKLEAYMKSEPIPDNSGPLKTAVAKNFEEEVTNNGKDTLIEFYAPWCGHCKKLTPIYAELAEKLKDEDVAIVKMDATANDVPPSFQVQGFPTLFWIPKNSRSSPWRYDGGREVDQFIKYIAKHATNELKGWDRNGNPKKKEEL
uniref:Protein disulfide-isomerase n=1 Tax=Lynceus sp. MCZ IZ 141354 TaxID=1930659 RepID=A0A9N6ZH34_9CRUS|nr:EOG090X0438 [Lynceus sp. MCZ IZ 141354]